MESKTIVTGQFEGSKKYFRGHHEKKKDVTFTKVIKKILKRTGKVKTNFF